MNLGRYGRALAQAALDSQSAVLSRARALERFYDRYRWLFSREDMGYIRAAVAVSGWSRVGYEILQERRSMAGLPADPRRFGCHPTASGLGIRALLMPAYLRRASSFGRPR